MKRVYLDQWVWVRLAKAALGRDLSPPVADALAVARFGAESGLLSFPLSPTHYRELLHTGNVRQRQEVGDLMLELSRGHRMIDLGETVVADEMDSALRVRFSRPAFPRKAQIFGIGMGHTFGFPGLRVKLVAKDGGQPQGIDPVQVTEMEALANELLERFALTGLDSDDYDPSADRRYESAFVAAEIDQADRFQRHGGDAARQRRVLLAREIIRLRRQLYEALVRAGLDIEWFIGQGADSLADFMMDMPAVFAKVEMCRLQHRNPQKQWSRNDSYDVAALSMATAYCDIVVTEKYWTRQIRQAGLDRRNSTLVISDLRELAGILASAA